ncbi:hypothetical protein JTB14_032906 [Gonioctena quinquepunctata]|nr:hypothetical protein JTB14_032906 [Gonioctena quinquepunctata]
MVFGIYAWFSLLRKITLRRGQQKAESTNTSKTSPLQPENYYITVEDDVDSFFRYIAFSDVLILFLFFWFSFYIAETGRVWIHLLLQFWAPIIERIPQDYDSDDD